MNLFPDSSQYINPYPFFKEMRQSNPVVYDSNQGIWGVYRYDDVKRVLTEYTTFSSEEQAPPQHGMMNRPKTLLSSDPPFHKKFRDLVSKAFSPKVIQDMEPRIEAIASNLLEKVRKNNEIELIKDFAAPLPTIVIAEMLGIPAEDRELFKRWSDQLINTEGEGSIGSKRPDRQKVL